MDFIRLCASRLHDDQSRGVEIPDTLSSPEQRNGAYKAFRALVRGCNPWWNCIWTVQEAMLPKNAAVRWGPLSLPWGIVEEAAFALCSPRAPLPPPYLVGSFNDLINDFTSPVRGLQISRKISEGPLNVQRWRERKATDPRDKVHVLAGLLQHTSVTCIGSCDYAVTPVSLYTDITASLINAEKGLRPLVGVRAWVTPGLPSWALELGGVPDMEASEWCWNRSHRSPWFSTAHNEPLHLGCSRIDLCWS